MKILLDTHILLWALADAPQLSDAAREMILREENEIYFSIISLWEVELKRLSHPDKMNFGSKELASFCSDAGYIQLDLKNAHIDEMGHLKRKTGEEEHKDPFDRILLSQAHVEKMVFLTHDKLIAGYDSSAVRLA